MSYRNRSRDTAPRWITARFDSKCAETGQAIKAGEEVLHYPREKKVYSTGSQTAADWRGQQQADSYGLLDANW